MTILAIDQGTTSTRAIVFDDGLRPLTTAQREFPQHFPRSGWVEHDPADLWATTQAVVTEAAKDHRIAAIGITNQRETVVLWDRKTGEAVANAIVWQDRRTARFCDTLRDAGHEQTITDRTGLLIDPYFSATKLKWLLDEVPDARARAERGELAFGTVDSFLVWHLTGGAHVTDATNACRTMLFNITTGDWDAEICAMLDIPMSLLPEVRDNATEFGVTEILGYPVPILGMAGDQQAATMGQACFAPGMMKSTYGTGCFALLNTGGERVASQHRLLTTIAWRLDGQATYALEGSIFIAGAVVQWLRDAMGVVAAAPDTQGMAERADDEQDVVLVPAFTGLGAPWWQPDSRGAIFGLTRNTGPQEFARAALQSVGFQTRDLLEAMRADWSGTPDVLRVDGGMARSDWTMQFLADIIGAPVDRPRVTETTALGVAWLAGWQAGICGGMDDFAARWALDRRFDPGMEEAERDRRYAHWTRAVKATIGV
ncbi:glycerol kinase GlpK [Falsirhodobacter halotolerans]|uniref:glycerol kinase GlpK n=1 Tax=Falsirhodobacter halotolerans TaxID=1146892 RepID=UPI001FD25A67|nr:glycerol kinase GlpK [Falsirhodobacter halotolerans]MCJ8140455.1 glycerol kinase GlpK [Falsirhodobacter halotolerans]